MRARLLRFTLGAAAAAVLYAGCGSNKSNGFDATEDGGPGSPNFGQPGSEGGASSGVFNDGSISGDGCTFAPGGPGPITRTCTPATSNECDGKSDLAGFAPNGGKGNGFDDDCDGLVDEGCTCTSAGTTKDCWMVPASQTLNGQPTGWCKDNSKGSLDCLGGEFPTWSGQCRGAQPPYQDDACVPGDFDCDGKDQNPRTHDCQCTPGKVVCPTVPITTAPFPNPTNLPLKIDATTWFDPPSSAAGATGWKWTMVGGDCDNVLPHPTFSMFPSNNGAVAPSGAQENTLGPTGKEHGIVWSGAGSTMYPAFSLSGDYVLTVDFDAFGQHHTCTQKIQVRAPGIRAEACWDTEPQLVDLDLHVAKVGGFSCGTQGWSDTCKNQDCYYYSCQTVPLPPPFPPPGTVNWGYGTTPASDCVGWGSATNLSACPNPRLDRDANGSSLCDQTVTDPAAIGVIGGFCGPENINIDQPADGSTYAVSVKYYGGSGASAAHVNIYCNGERVLSSGYNPVTGTAFPKLTQAGTDPNPNLNGDLWKVGLVTAHVQNGALTCDVSTTHSKSPRAPTDGSTSFCVDNSSSDGAASIAQFTSSGSAPANADALCFH